jgi:hypothetical protein
MVLAQKQTSQMDQLEDPDINPLIYSHLSSTKELKTHDGETITSSTNAAGKTWIFSCRRLKLDHCISHFIKINSKWIKDLNIRPEA